MALNVKEIVKIPPEVTETLWIFPSAEKFGTLLRCRYS